MRNNISFDGQVFLLREEGFNRYVWSSRQLIPGNGHTGSFNLERAEQLAIAFAIEAARYHIELPAVRIQLVQNDLQLVEFLLCPDPVLVLTITGLNLQQREHSPRQWFLKGVSSGIPIYELRSPQMSS